jgi:tight adherence protein B
MVHRQTGGNLAELLDKLSGLVRERERIRGSMQSQTAGGRFQALILLALPVLLFGVLMLVNRPYISLLFDHPLILYVTGGIMLLGALSMRRIVDFDF